MKTMRFMVHINVSENVLSKFKIVRMANPWTFHGVFFSYSKMSFYYYLESRLTFHGARDVEVRHKFS